jgi:hypothetical protein
VAITDINMPMINYDPEGDGYGDMVDGDNDIFLTNVFTWLTANRAPSVEVSAPNGGETVSGQVAVNWTSVDLDDDPLTYTVSYSDDGGGSWISIATGIVGLTFSWNTTLVENGEDYLIRVRASDGDLTGQDVSDATFTVDNPIPSDGGGELPITLILAAAAAVVIVIVVILFLQKRPKK